MRVSIVRDGEGHFFTIAAMKPSERLALDAMSLMGLTQKMPDLADHLTQMELAVLRRLLYTEMRRIQQKTDRSEARQSRTPKSRPRRQAKSGKKGHVRGKT